MSTIEIDMVAADAEAVRVLTDGPMTWLAELDLLALECEGPRRPQPGELAKIRKAMMDLELAGAWFDPQSHVLYFPASDAPARWAMWHQPGPVGTKWRKVTAEVDRW